MKYRILLLAIAIFVLLAPMSAKPATSMIDIKNNMFTPSDITIKAGDTVTWTNQDPVKHDIDFESFKSPLLGKGETYTHTFETAGTYTYDCDVHPFMKGRVIVQ